MHIPVGSKGLRRAIVLVCALTLGGGMSGCVTKAKYNKALAENQACQQRVADQDQRLGQLHSSLMDLHLASVGTAAGSDMRDEDIIAVLRTQYANRDAELARFRSESEQALTYQLLAKYLFPSGSAELTPMGRDALEKVSVWLKESQANNIFVQGFTDDVPIGPNLKRKYASNWELSAHRATTVVRFLVDSGIPEERLIAVGYGDGHPEEAGTDETARQVNRRIEIKLNNGEFKQIVAQIPTTVPTDSLIDVNRATVAELIVLPGVSPDFARSVVDYRQRAGRINSFDELRQVRGFDEERMSPLRSMVSFSGQRESETDTGVTDPSATRDEMRAVPPGNDSGKDMYLTPESSTDTLSSPKNTYPGKDDKSDDAADQQPQSNPY